MKFTEPAVVQGNRVGCGRGYLIRKKGEEKWKEKSGRTVIARKWTGNENKKKKSVLSIAKPKTALPRIWSERRTGSNARLSIISLPIVFMPTTFTGS